MYVSLETLRRAVGLVDSLAELDDPAGFADIVLPGLAALLGCDVLTYNETGPDALRRLPGRRARPGDPAGIRGARARTPADQLLPGHRQRGVGDDQRLSHPAAIPPPRPVRRVLPRNTRRTPDGSQPPGSRSGSHRPRAEPGPPRLRR